MTNYTETRIDLRSDTVTCPDRLMREAMIQAPVGDDVMGEDPTVNELEKYAAELCGKESALYLPSGTMANQAAVRAWCRNGEEALITSESHIFYYEAGSAAGLSGVQLNQVPAVDGIFEIEDFEAKIRPVNDPHFPLTRLLWVENTHNRGGGRIVPFKKMQDLFKLANEREIPLHIDGARLANAAVATGIPLSKWGQTCDSLSLCLSKGLGAPIGSILAGSEKFIQLCRRARKALGGGMRQAGIIAAAGLYALQNNIERLSVDHKRASVLAAELRKIQGLK
ncbi:low-specificity L-threonine aldolase, partial [bacterium]|nr:low-specificity L-threonine aldolase [bacterium]